MAATIRVPSARVAEPRWLDDDERGAWLAVLRFSVRFVDRLDRELQEEFDLTLGDYEILAYLSETPGGQLRMTELADTALVSRSRLTYRVDRLVDRGLVVRRSCPTDRRGVFAQLTASGRRMLERAAPVHVAGVRRYLIDHTTPRSRRSLVTLLQQAIDSLEPSSAPEGRPTKLA